MATIKNWIIKRSDKLIQLAIVLGLIIIVGLVVFYSNKVCIPCELNKLGGK